MDPVGELVDELRRNPSRFRARDGYKRLIELLRDGHPPDAVKRALLGEEEFVGDLLWSIAELENVKPFVSEAFRHISSLDKGTAAYAVEVVLRGSVDSSQLRVVLERLRSCDDAVCEHAVRILASQGVVRLALVFEAAGWTWAAALLRELLQGPLRHDVVRQLLSDPDYDHQIVGLVLVTLASEQDISFVGYLLCSDQTWIRKYGEWLKGVAARTRARTQ